MYTTTPTTTSWQLGSRIIQSEFACQDMTASSLRTEVSRVSRDHHYAATSDIEAMCGYGVAVFDYRSSAAQRASRPEALPAMCELSDLNSPPRPELEAGTCHGLGALQIR